MVSCADSVDFSNITVIDMKEKTYAEIEEIAVWNKRGKEGFCRTMLDSEVQCTYAWMDICVSSRRAIPMHGKETT